MSARFCSVLAVHDRYRRGVAAAAAQQLATAGGLPLTIFEVTATGSDESAAASDRRAVREIAAAIRARVGALVVLEALGGGPVADRLFDDEAEHLLTHLRLPMLVFGPRAEVGADPPVLLLVAADAGESNAAIVPVVTAWANTFETQTIVIGLDPPDPWPDDSTAPSVDPQRHIAAALRAAGVQVELQRRATTDPVDALLEAATSITGAVIVVPGARSSMSLNHWFSTSRQLIRRAPVPILVVS